MIENTPVGAVQVQKWIAPSMTRRLAWKKLFTQPSTITFVLAVLLCGQPSAYSFSAGRVAPLHPLGLSTTAPSYEQLLSTMDRHSFATVALSCSTTSSVREDGAMKKTSLVESTCTRCDGDEGGSKFDPVERMACAAAEWVASSPLFNREEGDESNGGFENSASTIPSPSYSTSSSYTVDFSDLRNLPSDVLALQVKTLVRVGVPSITLSALSVLLYPHVAMGIAAAINGDDGVFSVLSQDSSQYVQNILTTSGLMFSILVGYTYYFMYQQQEHVFLALFAEVTEAKSLLEQVALVCSGRSEMYPRVLHCMSNYVTDDLRRSVSTLDPARLLSSRPADDPLETIMYLTSVGTPGAVYETVRSLRAARADRLGALQKKLPDAHIWLLRILGCVVLATFPVCGSGSQVIGGGGILTVQSYFFGMLVFGIVMVLGVVTELWNPRGGAYNVDGVLSIMVRGLEEELRARMSGELGGGGVSGSDEDGAVLPYTGDLNEFGIEERGAGGGNSFPVTECLKGGVEVGEEGRQPERKRRRWYRWWIRRH